MSNLAIAEQFEFNRMESIDDFELKFKHVLIKFDIFEPGQIHIVLENY